MATGDRRDGDAAASGDRVVAAPADDDVEVDVLAPARVAGSRAVVEAPARPVVDEPPVVARLVIEVRSDGTRTIARGAMEDVVDDRRVAIEARGGSPLELALSLARSMWQLPAFARTAARGLLARGPRLPGRRR
jgi:hypothetical protein